MGAPRTILLLAAVAGLLVTASSGATAGRAAQGFADSFVTRSGPRLTLGGRPFRFGGANIEWLGVIGYGPADPAGPHFPSHYEVDDAMSTARELGATVVRSQTLGDSVGCAACIEPELGQCGVDGDGHATGRFVATGMHPRCAERIEHRGIRLPADLFARRIIDN